MAHAKPGNMENAARAQDNGRAGDMGDDMRKDIPYVGTRYLLEKELVTGHGDLQALATSVRCQDSYFLSKRPDSVKGLSRYSFVH